MAAPSPNLGDRGEGVALDFLIRRELRGERFSKDEMRKGKTPDFRAFKNDQFVLFCEAKHVQYDDWLDKLMDEAPPMTLVGGSRSDPVYNRLTTHIHNAAKQFKAVNADRKFPNVLVFTNSDHHCGMTDLVSVLTGNFYSESGSIDPIFKEFSEGRIREEKHTIDLYVWCNDYPGAKNTEQFFWNESSPHYQTLCSVLGSDPKKHKRV
ncbi:MAG: hypothetical protein DMG65_26980 [Candidatus Angelobacter sp. Gp1-AA117]|nr:MAG: hypothetical protein DMG65_26980 [Candidatus Angelobacter sp. Gp1-AA117]